METRSLVWCLCRQVFFFLLNGRGKMWSVKGAQCGISLQEKLIVLWTEVVAPRQRKRHHNTCVCALQPTNNKRQWTRLSWGQPSFRRWPKLQLYRKTNRQQRNTGNIFQLAEWIQLRFSAHDTQRWWGHAGLPSKHLQNTFETGLKKDSRTA